VLSGPERRRRWSEEQSGRSLPDAFSPRASVSEVPVAIWLLFPADLSLGHELWVLLWDFAEGVLVSPSSRERSGADTAAVDIEIGTRLFRVRIPMTNAQELASAVIKAFFPWRTN